VNLGSLQIGPDGRIYISCRGVSYISTIDHPNILGLGCDYVRNSLSLGTGSPEYGLPPFIQSQFNALPVEMVQYDAACDFGIPRLSWTTASEIHNDYFTIERSTDGLNFESIANVDGLGNSSRLASYTWSDDKPINGRAYYRLKQTDFDGMYEYHGITTVECGQSVDLNIYPNPFESSFTLELPESTIYPVKVEVMDCFGRLVYTQDIETNSIAITLDEPVSLGVYSVTVTSMTTKSVLQIMKLR